MRETLRLAFEVNSLPFGAFRPAPADRTITNAFREHFDSEIDPEFGKWHLEVIATPLEKLPLADPGATFGVIEEVWWERSAQDAKWGQQNHQDGTGEPLDKHLAYAARRACEEAFANGIGTWYDILQEEVFEAFAESDPAKLRKELIQVAAVASAWVEAIDRRAVSA